MVEIYKLFDLSHSRAKKYLTRFTYPWQAIEQLGGIIEELGATLSAEEFEEIKPQIWVHKKAIIASTVCIKSPCIIDEGAEIRHCAYIRGKAIIGKGAVVGNSVEIKNSILFDEAKAPHFNYVGDSILGYKAHLGAGAVTSNVKCDKRYIFVKCGHESHFSGLKKCGAFVGDNAEIGCNTVLNPGTVIGKDTIVYPTSSVRGVVPENSIYKNKNEIVERN